MESIENKVNEKIGDWLMDIAKYIITAVVITSFLGSFGATWKIYVFGIAIATFLLVVGLLYINKKRN